MDLKNLCQNFDVNSIRARIPSLPALPVLPQIKLPKSLPKLRSRRIFSRSREDINKNSPKQHQQQPEQSLPPPSDFIDHSPRRISTISSLMNQRDERHQGTYCSADSVDDDYPSPRQCHKQIPRPISPINTPISASNESSGPNVATAKLSLTERLQKGYKDITEFRLSHIFAKKTVVRKDTIQVDQYVERYNEDRERELAEQEKRDRKIAENYRFQFKVSRQDTKESKRSISSNESVECEPKQQKQQSGKVIKSVSEHSGDESGMEASPPSRKPEDITTRTAKMRNPPFQHSMSVESSNELYEGEEQPTIRRNQQNNISSPETATDNEIKAGKSAKALSKLRSIDKRSSTEATDEKKRQAPLSPQQSEERPESSTADENAFTALKQNLKRLQKSIKRPQPTQTDDSEGESTAKETKHISRTEKITSRLRRLTSRENSLDNLDETATTKEEKSETKSPIRAAISNKLQTLKKSFKKKSTTEADATNTGDETSPEKNREKEKRPDNLIKKLRNIRSRRNPHSSDDLDATEDEDGTPTQKPKRTSTSTRKVTHFEEKFEEARKRTVKKVNEKMQQMKFFHKSQENIDKEDINKKGEKHIAHQCVHEHTDDSDLNDDYVDDAFIHTNTCPKSSRRTATDNSPINSDQEEEEQIEEINNVQRECITQKTRTLWTTKNLLSDSLDSETDTEFPRVLIHQDNTDQFESTLIIAVTCPVPSTPTTTAIIEEIVEKPAHSRRTPTPTPSNKSVEWIPNTEIISSFLEITPPSKRRLSAEAILPAPRGHTRKMSMDSSSDSDSWIPENGRTKQLTTLNKENSQENSIPALSSIDENEEPWKVHTMYCEEKLYKAKSIDIFEANQKQGGVEAVFDDFEEELKNEPILKVQQRNVDSFEKESSEEPDAADDDNSSRVTKIRVSVIREENEEKQVCIEATKQSSMPMVPARHFGNSRESLIANIGDNAHTDNDDMDSTVHDGDDADNDDRPPSAAPSPPPNISPPPPPLPKRKPSILSSKPTVEPPPPPLPATKPPLPSTKPPPQIPERTPSMKRIAKPLVKTSSLRLAYNEQVKPADVGKVNKLISRFEQPPTKEPQRPRLAPRRLMREESDEYSDDGDDLDYDEEDDDDDDDTDEIETEAENANIKSKVERDTTPTNTPCTNSVQSNKEYIVRDTTRRQTTITTIVTSNTTATVPTLETTTKNKKESDQNLTTTFKQKNPKITIEAPKLALSLDVNSNANLSRASSEYGSPLEYPSSLIGSTETTPIPERRQHELLGRSAERNRRSMTRDDEKFLSFDSDDENSYYSISSSSSSRYVVEI